MRTMLLIAALLLLPCLAADGLKATVTGSGAVDVVPMKMDIVMVLREKGSDVNAAVDALKKRKDETLGKLKAIGVDIAQAKADAPEVAEKKGPNAMAAAMAAARGQRAKPKRDVDGEVALKQHLRVPVPLTGKDALAMIVETEPLKTNVLKALPEVLEGDEDEDTEGNPFAGMMAGQKKGALYFEFNAPKTAELEQKALAAALKSAKEKATAVAMAAGMKSAEPASITLQEAGKEGLAEGMASYYQMIMGAAAPAAKPSENIAGDTPVLKLHAAVSVEFLLK